MTVPMQGGKKALILSIVSACSLTPSSQYPQLASQATKESGRETLPAHPFTPLHAASLLWAQLGAGRRCKLDHTGNFGLQFGKDVLISE